MQRILLVMWLWVLFVDPNSRASHPILDDRNALTWSQLKEDDQRAIKSVLTRHSDADVCNITVDYPLHHAVFPIDMTAPLFAWRDSSPQADTWLIQIEQIGQRIMTQGTEPMRLMDTDPNTLSKETLAYHPPAPNMPIRRWRPGSALWTRMKQLSTDQPLVITIFGFNANVLGTIASKGQVTLTTSSDPVEAPIFYRDVPLPFAHALKNLRAIRWRLGEVSSATPPPVLLTNMKVCGNCHSFTADGKTLAMDVDYGSDKGSYVIAEVGKKTILEKGKVISWSDFQRNEKDPTFGLLSQISPDGRYVISTVKDRSVFLPDDDLFYSQRFFPITGILVVYDRHTRRFFSLTGADDRRYVQSNPVWSPDGRTILFARAKAYKLPNLKDPSSALLTREEVLEFFEGGKTFKYDIYSIPFNQGKGGTPLPLKGAAHNGKSNYFPRYSPDGKWIVFCQSESFMLLRPDSQLYSMPASGGEPHRLACNFEGHMNSWHSWSPNGKWMAFTSKVNGPFTQIWLTHMDSQGRASVPVCLEHFTAANRAANIPEFVNTTPSQFRSIYQNFADYYTHYRAGILHETRHQYREAIGEFHRALKEKPDHVESLYLLASCLARIDQEREAIPFARKAAQQMPNSAMIHGLLGGLLCNTGQHSEAVVHLQIAHKANPGDIGVAGNLAWLWATAPNPLLRNGPHAVRLAEWVNKTTAYKSPPLLDTLAAAYAEAGLFDKAISTTQQAIELVRHNPTASTTELESRLRLYKAGRPYHEHGE